MGTVVLSVALLMRHRFVARRLADPLGTGETLVAMARTHARYSLFGYLVLTLCGLAVVWSLTGNGLNAVLHVLAAVSCGGFSSFDIRLAGLGLPVAVALMVFAFCKAGSLPLYWQAVHAGLRNECVGRHVKK